MAIKVRVRIVSCIICNVDIMTPSKGWTIAIAVVCGRLIGAHVIFKVTISVIVFQRVYEGVGRVMVWAWRPWRETYVIVKNCRTGSYLSLNYHNDVTHGGTTLSGTIKSYVYIFNSDTQATIWWPQGRWNYSRTWVHMVRSTIDLIKLFSHDINKLKLLFIMNWDTG